MVGQTSEQLESDGSNGLNDRKLREEIAPYLLLHHNYAAKPIDVIVKNKLPNKGHRKSKTNVKTNKRKLKEIRPKTEINCEEIVLTDNDIDMDLDGDNFITIIVQDDLTDETDINEIVIEDNSDTVNENLLNVPSPKYCSSISSDGGYESYDSPLSLNDNDSSDIWDPCVGELFPSLI